MYNFTTLCQLCLQDYVLDLQFEHSKKLNWTLVDILKLFTVLNNFIKKRYIVKSKDFICSLGYHTKYILRGDQLFYEIKNILTQSFTCGGDFIYDKWSTVADLIIGSRL